MLRPAHHRRYAVTSLVGRIEELAAPRAIRTAVNPALERARGVVAAEHHDCVVCDASRLGRGESLTGTIVQLGQAICIQPPARFARKIRMHAHRRMNLKKRYINEERLLWFR